MQGVPLLDTEPKVRGLTTTARNCACDTSCNALAMPALPALATPLVLDVTDDATALATAVLMTPATTADSVEPEM
jgi:hypothetical protein